MVRKAPLVVSFTGATLSGNNIITTQTGSSVAIVSVSNTLAAGAVVVFTSLQTVSVGNGAHPRNKLLTVTSASPTRFEVAMGSAATGGLTTIAIQTTTTSQWYELDYEFDPAFEKGVFCTLCSASNQSIRLQVGASAPDVNGSVANFHTVSTYTGSNTDSVLAGNWPCVRVVGVSLDGTNTIVITR